MATTSFIYHTLGLVRYALRESENPYIRLLTLPEAVTRRLILIAAGVRHPTENRPSNNNNAKKRLCVVRRKWGVHARHIFPSEKRGNGGKWAELESIEVFSGPLLWAARLAGLHRRLPRLTLQLLKAIREDAESPVADSVEPAGANNAEVGLG